MKTKNIKKSIRKKRELVWIIGGVLFSLLFGFGWLLSIIYKKQWSPYHNDGIPTDLFENIGNLILCLPDWLSLPALIALIVLSGIAAVLLMFWLIGFILLFPFTYLVQFGIRPEIVINELVYMWKKRRRRAGPPDRNEGDTHL